MLLLAGLFLLQVLLPFILIQIPGAFVKVWLMPYIRPIWIGQAIFGIVIFWLMRKKGFVSISVGFLAIFLPVYAAVFYLLTLLQIEYTMTSRNLKLISKYALLLSLLYIIEYVTFQYLRDIKGDDLMPDEVILVSIAPTIVVLILNIITSIVVFRDKVKHKIETRYVILATVIYRPVGVIAFLLYSIYEDISDGTVK